MDLKSLQKSPKEKDRIQSEPGGNLGAVRVIRKETRK
jgi:hypothetical protein